jgi:hypothetical protein
VSLENKLLALSILLALHVPVFAIDLAEGCTVAQPATDKNVFNWRFYLNANPDLPSLGGANSPQLACAHWLSNGIGEGRQAHAGFHSAQYLLRYPDLVSAYGAAGYANAISHFINYGMAEGRLGYLQNGMADPRVKRTTIQGTAANGGKIYISTGSRTAGAVDSLMLNNVEFINAWDFGRELQVAMATPPWGEGYNPTEAGSCDDRTPVTPEQMQIGEGTTTSVLRHINANSASELETSSTPAFWYRPNGACSAAENVAIHNTTAVANNFTFHKNIQIGYAGFSNVVRFLTQIDIAEPLPVYAGQSHSMAVEAPTGYLGGEFNKIIAYNPVTKQVKDLSVSTTSCAPVGTYSGQADPLIFSKADGSYAMGICTAGAAGGNFFPTNYVASSFVNACDAFESTTKWTAIFALKDAVNPQPIASFNFATYITVAEKAGAVTAVQAAKNTIDALYQQGICK